MLAVCRVENKYNSYWIIHADDDCIIQRCNSWGYISATTSHVFKLNGRIVFLHTDCKLKEDNRCENRVCGEFYVIGSYKIPITSTDVFTTESSF